MEPAVVWFSLLGEGLEEGVSRRTAGSSYNSGRVSARLLEYLEQRKRVGMFYDRSSSRGGVASRAGRGCSLSAAVARCRTAEEELCFTRAPNYPSLLICAASRSSERAPLPPSLARLPGVSPARGGGASVELLNDDQSPSNLIRLMAARFSCFCASLSLPAPLVRPPRSPLPPCPPSWTTCTSSRRSRHPTTRQRRLVRRLPAWVSRPVIRLS